jgi:hypothetical protein
LAEQRLQAIAEALDEIFGIFGGGLASGSVQEADEVFGGRFDRGRINGLLLPFGGNAPDDKPR